MIKLLFFFLEDFFLGMIQVFVFVVFFDDGEIVDRKVDVNITRILIQIH